MHHASYDGMSLPLLWRRFTQNYAAIRAGTAVPTHESESFSRFAEHIHLGQRLAVQYWAQQLRGYIYQPLALAEPSDSAPNDNGERMRRARSHANVGPEQYAEVKCKCRELDVTSQAAMVLAWSKVLALQVLGQSDVAFGQVLSGRSLTVEGENAGEQELAADTVIGPTLNTVALRVVLDSALSNRQALQKTQKLVEGAQQHQMASLRMVQNEWRASTPGASATSPFESLLVFNGDGSSVVDASDSPSELWNPTRLASAEQRDGSVEYPLVCSVSASRDGLLHIQISASTDKLDDSDVHKLSLAFATELVGQMDNTDASSVPPSLALQKTGHNPDGPQEASVHCESADVGEEHRELRQVVLDAVQSLLHGTLGESARQAVDAHTNLFRVGLDSILAIRLSSQLKRSKAPLTVNQIMQGKTIDAILARMHQDSLRKRRQHTATGTVSTTAMALMVSQTHEAAAIEQVHWTAEQVESVLPCLAGQEHHLEYWMFAGYRFFQAPWVYRVNAEVSVEGVQRAWDELRKRHAILRSTFVAEERAEGGPRVVQVTGTPPTVDSRTDGTFTYVRDDEASTLDAIVVQHVQDTNDQPSDLLLPPVQLALLQKADGEGAIVMRLHHALYDAWSVRMLIRDFDVLLADHELPPPAWSLTTAIPAIFTQRNIREEQAFWSQALRHAQPTILAPKAAISAPTSPADAGPLGPQHLVRLPSVLSASTVRGVEMLCQTKANCALSPAVLLAFATTLAERSSCSSPTFGFYHASRSLGALDLTQAAVPTMTLTPMTVEIGGETDESGRTSGTMQKLQAVQDSLGQLTQFGQASMHDILRSIGAGERPLFTSYINLLYRNSGSPDAAQHATASVLERLRPSSNTYFTDTKPRQQNLPCLRGLDTSHIDPLRLFVDVVIDTAGDGISLGIRCDPALYDVAEVEQFAQRFVHHIVSIERELLGA